MTPDIDATTPTGIPVVLGSPKKVLVIDPFVPHFDRNSGHARLYATLRVLLSEGHDITYIARQRTVDTYRRYADHLRDLGITLFDGDPVRLQHEGIGSNVPPLDDQAVFGDSKFDAAYISFHSVAARYMPLLRKFSPHTKIIVDSVDLAYRREFRMAEQTHDPADYERAEQTRVNELAIYREADIVVAITNLEKKEILREVGKNTEVIVIPNIHSCMENVPPFAKRDHALFVANFLHNANEPSILWFCKEVLPLVRKKLPTFSLDIVGQNPPAALQEFTSQGVQIHGWVPHLEPYLKKARIAIAPLVVGAGMKGKVGDALAAGLPIVTTNIGAEGMGMEHGVHALIADDPAEFAEACVQLYADENLWNSLSQNGQKLITQNYTSEYARATVRGVLGTTTHAPVLFAGVPNWNDVEALGNVVAHYIREFQISQSSTLALFTTDLTAIEEAGNILVSSIVAHGFDPERIPNVSLSPITQEQLNALPVDAIWIPFANSLARQPAHLSLVDASLSRSSSDFSRQTASV